MKYKVKDLKTLLEDCDDEREVCVAFVESSGYQRGLVIGATTAFKGMALGPDFNLPDGSEYVGNLIIQAEVPPGTLAQGEDR